MSSAEANAPAPFAEVFSSSFRLSERVCIVAPGPNGRGHYASIPQDFQVIAVSKAVLIPEVRADVWMMNHAHQDWFPAGNARFHGICVFSDSAMRTVSTLAGKKACYYFTPPPGEPLEASQVRPVDGFIRVGASVSACAVQLAYNFGAREILLCGVDMSGDEYWDGTINVQPSHGEVWPAVTRLNPLLAWMREQGIRLATLSPTKLDLPFYRPGRG